MILFITAFVAGIVSLAAVIYPFRPFGTRRRAAVSFIISFVAFVLSPLLIDVEGTTIASGLSPERQAEVRARINPETESEADPTSERARSARNNNPAQQNVEISKTVPQDQYEKLLARVDNLEFAPVRYRLVGLEREGFDLGALLPAIEERTLAVVRPIPASDIKANLEGYQLLVAVRPDNSDYATKVQQYRDRKEQAQNTARNDEERARRAVISRLRTDVDKIEGITWYKHPNQPPYVNSRSTVHLYIGKRNGSRPTLRMKVTYAASNWLFVEDVEAWHDGVKEPLISGRFERDNHSSIWEWMDVSPDARQLLMLESLGKANEAILRFNGMQYRKDVTLSAGDKRALLEMIEAYTILSESR